MTWLAVMPRADLGASPVRRWIRGEALAVFRTNAGVVGAVRDACPHRFAPLSAGKVRPDGRLECAYHGWHFDCAGRGQSPSDPGRANCDTVAYEARVAGGYVWVDSPDVAGAATAGSAPILELGNDTLVECAHTDVLATEHAVFAALDSDAARRAVAEVVDVDARSFVTSGRSVRAELGRVQGTMLLTVAGAELGTTRVHVLRLGGVGKSDDGACVADAVLNRLVRVLHELASPRALVARRRLTVLPPQATRGLRPYVVTHKERAATDLFTFALEPVDGRPIERFVPGQHLVLRVPDGPGRRPRWRCYSISSAPNEPFYRIGVRRVEALPGQSTASSHLADRVEPGDVIYARGPQGDFRLEDVDSPAVFVAGGVGITPVLSMLRARLCASSRGETQVLYGVRDVGSALDCEWLFGRADAGEINLALFASREAAGSKQSWVRAGRLRASDVLGAVTDPRAHHYYLCGPTTMMNEVATRLVAEGVARERIHAEAFGPASIEALTVAGAGGGAANATVTFRRSGISATCDPSVASILDLAHAHGVDIDFGCRSGSCGACETPLVSGEVNVRGRPTTPARAGCIFPCLSAPRTNVVLDA